MKQRKISFVLNLVIFILEIGSMVWMMSGISAEVLADAKFAALKYFTVDSNILMGIAALIVAIGQWKVLKGKKTDLSVFHYAAALTGTVGVTLTMLITIFFLAPTMGATYGVWSLFAGSNFLLHLLNPILSIVVFLLFERTDKIRFRYTWVGIIPLVIYGIYYTAAAMSHMQGNTIEPGYDWYGFFLFGAKSALIVLPLIIAITYGISVLLWRLNKPKKENIQ